MYLHKTNNNYINNVESVDLVKMAEELNASKQLQAHTTPLQLEKETQSKKQQTIANETKQTNEFKEEVRFNLFQDIKSAKLMDEKQENESSKSTEKFANNSIEKIAESNASKPVEEITKSTENKPIAITINKPVAIVANDINNDATAQISESTNNKEIEKTTNKITQNSNAVETITKMEVQKTIPIEEINARIESECNDKASEVVEQETNKNNNALYLNNERVCEIQNYLTDKKINKFTKKIVRQFKTPYKRTLLKKALTVLCVASAMVAFSYVSSTDLLENWVSTYLNAMKAQLSEGATHFKASDFIAPEVLGTTFETMRDDFYSNDNFRILARIVNALAVGRVLVSAIPSPQKNDDKEKIFEKISDSNLCKEECQVLVDIVDDQGSAVALYPEIFLAKTKYLDKYQKN